jgi:hypothetical protein
MMSRKPHKRVRPGRPAGDGSIVPYRTLRPPISGVEPRTIAFPSVSAPSGTLTYIDGERRLPFTPQRVYYIHGIPTDAERGGHAHRETHELIVALCGEFRVNLERPDGRSYRFLLNDPEKGLFVPPLLWRVLDGYQEDSLCLVLASTLFEENDYIRDYRLFRRERAAA